jgi:integrase
MMMTAMAISPMMRNVLSVARMLPIDVMASDTATIAPTTVPMIRRMSPLCAPGPLAGHGRAGRLRANPAHRLGLPRIQRRDYVFLTHEQLRDLAAETGPWRVFVLLLGYTGLRWGEATALRVCDVDPARRRIDVPRAFSDVGGRVVLGTPKSHQSRAVPMPRFLAREIAAVTTGKDADDLVFTMPRGTALRLSNWRQLTFLPARRCRAQRPVPHPRLAAHRRLADDPGRIPAKDAARDHGARQHHHDT